MTGLGSPVGTLPRLRCICLCQCAWMTTLSSAPGSDRHLRLARILAVTAGIALGLTIGLAALPTSPPCSPADAPSEVVVRRFLERLGSSESAILDCWTPGALRPKELQSYLHARPPKRVSLLNVYAGHSDTQVLVQWEVSLTWDGPPPDGWQPDESRFIVLARQDRPVRWTIETTQPPLRQ